MPLAVGRVERLGAPHLQLSAVALVVDPFAADLGALPGGEVGDGPTKTIFSPKFVSSARSTA